QSRVVLALFWLRLRVVPSGGRRIGCFRQSGGNTAPPYVDVASDDGAISSAVRRLVAPPLKGDDARRQFERFRKIVRHHDDRKGPIIPKLAHQLVNFRPYPRIKRA